MVAVGSELFLFGGVKASTGKCCGELFSIPCFGQMTAWKSLASGPERADFGSLVAFERNLFLFGGTSAHAYHNDVHFYSIAANMWHEFPTTGDIPSPRSRHSTCIWKSFLIVYGGSNKDDFDPAVYLLDLNIRRWHKVCPNPGRFFPEARRDHGAVVIKVSFIFLVLFFILSRKDSLYVYGGKISRTAYADPVLLRLSLPMVNPNDPSNLSAFSFAAPGHVFAAGFAGHGALGLGKTENVLRPVRIEALQRLVISATAAGGRSVVLEASGDVYEFGQGHEKIPRLVHLGSRVVAVKSTA
jgi:hypothetical protein